MNNITKIDDSTLEVTKEAVVLEPVVNSYTIDFLKKQELDILKQMNDYITQRQKELDEVRVLIAESERLGLKTEEQIRTESVAIEAAKLDGLTQ